MLRGLQSKFLELFTSGTFDKLVSRLDKIPSFLYVLPVILISVGIRLRNYIANRALWLDEATLGLNIIKRTYTELLEPLDTLQVAPIGFLMVERFFVEQFGTGEQVLRLLPFIAGIISIILLYFVTKRLTSSKIALIASVLFTFSYYLIYYTVEVKQYILDVFFLLIIVRFIFDTNKRDISIGRFIVSGLIGAIAVWFSNVSVLVLTGVGIWMGVSILKRRSISHIMGYLFMTAFWLGSFFLYYWYFVRNHPHSDLQVNAFQSINYLPGTSGLTGTVKWILSNLGGLFEYGIGRTGGTIGIILTLVAFYFIYRRKDYTLLILLLPLLTHLVLSLFSIYPFGRRFTLYFIPVVFIYMSYGLYHLFRLSKVTTILIPVFLIIIVYDHAKLSKEPILKQEIREPMQYIGQHYQEGDIIYVQYGSRWAFEYYQDRYISKDCNVFLGTWIRDHPDRFEKEMETLTDSKRIWVLFSNYYPSEMEMVMNGCELYGQKVDSLEVYGASAYLIEIFTPLNH